MHQAIKQPADPIGRRCRRVVTGRMRCLVRGPPIIAAPFAAAMAPMTTVLAALQHVRGPGVIQPGWHRGTPAVVVSGRISIGLTASAPRSAMAMSVATVVLPT